MPIGAYGGGSGNRWFALQPLLLTLISVALVEGVPHGRGSGSSEATAALAVVAALCASSAAAVAIRRPHRSVAVSYLSAASLAALSLLCIFMAASGGDNESEPSLALRALRFTALAIVAFISLIRAALAVFTWAVEAVPLFTFGEGHKKKDAAHYFANVDDEEGGFAIPSKAAEIGGGRGLVHVEVAGSPLTSSSAASGGGDAEFAAPSLGPSPNSVEAQPSTARDGLLVVAQASPLVADAPPRASTQQHSDTDGGTIIVEDTPHGRSTTRSNGGGFEGAQQTWDEREESSGSGSSTPRRIEVQRLPSLSYRGNEESDGGPRGI